LNRTLLASPASNGGRGLKQCQFATFRSRGRCIARQQWRARIETHPLSATHSEHLGIARQQWRARIETLYKSASVHIKPASPASNGGRGLKQASDLQVLGRHQHRPPAMAGAD